MPDDPNVWRVVGSLESDMRAIKDLLKEANDQRREFQGDIRMAVTEMQTFIPMIKDHDTWIEDEGKPAVNGMKRAKHIALGAMGVSAVGSSPSWVGKVAAFFQALVP